MIYINYQNIARTVEYFTQSVGFKRVEVPWVVPNTTARATAPISETNRFQLRDRSMLIGSAEQGILEMIRDGYPMPMRALAVSPCFRDEAKYDDWHLPFFMKVELFIRDADQFSVIEMVDHAMKNFKDMSSIQILDDFEVVKTEDGVDINLGGIEIGSYGLREWNGIKWGYGTALAEPRFTAAALNVHMNQMYKRP